MKTHKQLIALAVLLAAGIAAYFGWAAWRAHSNLVTLDVRNMEVREVVRKLEWQTWENIYVNRNVQGKVTLRVRGVPLDEVLRMIGEQTASRSLVLFALYSSGDSLSKLEQSVRGEVDPATHGWTNLVSALAVRGGSMGPGPMLVTFGPGANPFDAMADNSNRRVSLDLRGKDLSFATLAFNRFAQARVVPEDGASGAITLSLNKVPVAKAVAKLASKVSRRSKKIYALQGMRGPGGPSGPGDGPQMVRVNGGPEMMVQRGPDGPSEMTDQQREEMRQKRAAQENDLKSALPAEERQKLEQREAERRQQMQEMANMTPEQRRAQMDQTMRANGGLNQMLRQRVLNSTPEQRADMIRREKDMRQRFGQPGNPPPAPR
ncbi:MAG TPA: hypothetical protein VK530_06670 [Candidatus Acidoferrum sp.]|nr:hypothetical protein [Candidatus Acidoferrum sp.]